MTMSKKLKIIILVALIFLGLIVMPSKREEVAVNPVEEFAPEDADEVMSILHKACYDCHSYETHYPWYASVAPISFWLNKHIEHGREHLNFSIWHTYSIDERNEILEEFGETISEKKMPMLSYWIVHWEAKLSDEERKTLVDYFEKL